MNHKPSKIKKLKTSGKMRGLMADYFHEVDEASRSDAHKVAWCTSVGPAELLRSFGFHVYFPENHGAMLGASRIAADLIPAGWLAVPVVEASPSWAAVGERVVVTAGGVIVSDAGVIVADLDGAPLVAVPAEAAPRVALANDAGVTLLRTP